MLHPLTFGPDFLMHLDDERRRQRMSETTEAYEHTFDWLFDPSIGFIRWLQSKHSERQPIFWISGKPASGKSTLMKFAMQGYEIRHHLSIAGSGGWNIIPFFFHDRGTDTQKTVNGLFQEILFQLLRLHKELLNVVLRVRIPQVIRTWTGAQQGELNNFKVDANHDSLNYLAIFQNKESLRKHLLKCREWALETLTEVLVTIMRQSQIPLKVLFFIDALDEHAGDPISLAKLLRSCLLSTTGEGTQVKLCLSNRPEPAFVAAFGSCPTFRIHNHTMGDIQKYAYSLISGSYLVQDYESRTAQQLRMLVDDVVYNANGVFIWVRLVVQELLEKSIDGSTFLELKRILSETPGELRPVFLDILRKRKPEYGLECYILTQIVTHSKTHQTLESLFAAVGVVLHGRVEKMTQNDMVRRLSSRCDGLLEVNEEVHNVVHFLHKTVKDFFSDGTCTTAIFQDK